MNDIKQEQTTTVRIYREFFAKAQAEVKKQLLAIKSASYCLNCKKCCQLRYCEFSPSELNEQGMEEFLELFKPLSYKGQEITIENNHKKALEIDANYVQKVINNSDKNCWFYSCKYLENGNCTLDKEKPLYCSSYPNNAYFVLHDNCGFKKWQKEALDKLENQMAQDVLCKIKEIDNYKNNFSCSCCSTCCKIASSEFSYEELKEKAQNGDKFAQQFVSVFVPYEDENQARIAYAEYIDYLYEILGKEEKYYFYYCPKNKNKLCSDYENRPEICREFPTNPLMILPKTCGYKAWQEETHTATLLLHALVEIIDFYIKRIKKVL